MARVKEESGSKPVVRPFPQYTRFPTNLERRIYRTWNYIRNSLWPVSPSVFLWGFGATTAFYWRRPELLFLVDDSTGGQKALRCTLLSLTTVGGGVFALRFFLRHFYFGYKGFLHENAKKPSLKTRLWAICGRILSFVPVQLKSCEALLPNLPLPPLKDTVDRYLESMRELLSEDDYENLEKEAKAFILEEGPRLQKDACDLWHKYAYQATREGLLGSSSVAHADIVKPYPALLAVRAARYAYTEFQNMLAIDRQEIKPIANGMLCASHYDDLYAATRVPGKEVDHFDNYGISRHIVVLYQGNIYKVEMCDKRNQIYELEDLTKIFADIVDRDERDDSVAGRVAALTTDRREQWAANRTRFFLDNVQNRQVLEIIESAAFAFSVTDDVYGWTEDTPDGLSNQMRETLTGNGINRWADKSLNYVCSRNGRTGGTSEHSMVDGPEFDHLGENHIYTELYVLTHPGSLEEQKQFVEDLRGTARPNVIFAERLQFSIDEAMAAEIERCYADHQVTRTDVDLADLYFREFGKGRIKKGNCSPDGFMQMAIQLANFKDQGKFVLTYESASVRFFKNSRTETLRSVTSKSCAFVRAMLDPNETKSHRLQLLREACLQHVQNNKECMIGRGVDRHLFVLYVISKYRRVSSPFLESVFSQKWLLSTSNLPVCPNALDEDADIDAAWLGAGFTAVAKAGYGLCYRFQGNHSILCAISSWKSATNTVPSSLLTETLGLQDSARFQEIFVDCLREMVQLFD